MPKFDHLFDPTRYATVAERITLFRSAYPEGRIVTDLVQRDEKSVTFRADVYRDSTEPVPAATGWATEREGDGDINTVACLENSETSAIGRALANLGYTASRERPSREEMEKASRERARRAVAASLTAPRTASTRLAEPAAAYATLIPRIEDVLALLGDAEALGLRGERVERLRSTLNSGAPISAQRLETIARALRTWLRDHDPVTAIRHLL